MSEGTKVWRTFARLQNGRVSELFRIEEDDERLPDLTEGAVEVTGTDAVIGDEHDGSELKEREPAVYHAIRAIVMTLKENHQAGKIVVSPEALAIFQKVKANL